MENITELSSNSWSESIETFDCNEITNNGLYAIFATYLLPLLSPKVRDYGREFISSFRNAGKVASEYVSLTEYGFAKIQNLSNNEEMTSFIQRVCDKQNIDISKSKLSAIAWGFSGDSQNGKKPSLQQTWNKLLNDLKDIETKGPDNKP